MSSTLVGWIKIIDIPQLLLGAFMGACIGIFLENFIKRPKLVIAGSGGGGGPGIGFYQNNLRILNEPGLLGPKIKGTTILGKKIHGPIEKVLPFDRIPAHECTGHIYDKKTDEYIRPLWWRSITDPNRIMQTINLNSGESADLMLFARLDKEHSKYFVYEPENNSVNSPKIPPEDVKFDDTREFIIEVQYAYGRKKFKTDIKMIKGFDGKLSHKGGAGGGSF